MVVWPDELGRQWLFDATSVPIGMLVPQLFPPKENPEPRASLERWHSGRLEPLFRMDGR